jgi:hypothetical protein
VRNLSNSSPTLTNATVTASGGINETIGVVNEQSSPVMTDVTVTASGGSSNNYGVDNYISSPTMTDVIATAYGGTVNHGVYNITSCSPIIKTSSISGTTNSIVVVSSTAMIAATMLDGAVTGIGFTCVGAYDGSFAALNTSCQ